MSWSVALISFGGALLMMTSFNETFNILHYLSPISIIILGIIITFKSKKGGKLNGSKSNIK